MVVIKANYEMLVVHLVSRHYGSWMLAESMFSVVHDAWYIVLWEVGTASPRYSSSVLVGCDIDQNREILFVVQLNFEHP